MPDAQDASIPSIFSNEAFLRAAAGPVDWSRVKVAMFLGDPEKQPRGAWQGFPAGDILKAPHVHLNTYFSVGLQTGGSRGLAGFERIFAIVLDDVGVKVDLAAAIGLMGVGPSYVLETSPGNRQAGWFCDLRSRDWALGLVTALYEALGAGDNLKNLVGYMRLPVGTNGKTRLGPGGFKHRLLSWSPQVRVGTLDWVAIEARIGKVKPIDRRLSIGPAGRASMPDPGEIEEDGVLRAFRLLGRVQGLGRPTTMGWGFDVDCPWIDEHTDRAQEGATYVPVKGRFHCHHGHCQDRRMEDVRARLDELLRDQVGPGTSLAGLEFDDLADDQVDELEELGLVSSSRPLASYEASEGGVVLAFADRYHGQLVFDHTRGCWLRWTGAYWRADEVQHHFRLIWDLCRDFKNAHVGLTLAQQRVIAKTSFAVAVERAARTHKAFAVSGLDWNQDIWVCGAPGTEIDLRTGQLVPPDPAHGISKQLLVAPDFGMAIPIWDQFLWDSTGGDLALIAFLQVWCGYCLTGDVSEERFVFIHGLGGNGKSTFIETIAAILNDYAAKAEADMFMQRRRPEHREEIARLVGVRSVTASEIDDNRTFNAARLKDFTGQDKITGRFMRQNTFEFFPQFKITFNGNNQPRLPDTGPAIQRRLVLVPFTQVPKVVDIGLKARLVPEYPGILAWMIQGELMRRAAGGLTGLIPQAAVVATRDYIASQDLISTWAEERCMFRTDETVGVTDACEDYRLWCHQQGENGEISLKKFGQRFLEKFPQCERKHTNKGSVLVHVMLAPQDVVNSL